MTANQGNVTTSGLIPGGCDSSQLDFMFQGYLQRLCEQEIALVTSCKQELSLSQKEGEKERRSEINTKW